MHTITINQKGQITIPLKIRKKLRLVKGARLLVEEHDMKITIRPDTHQYIQSLEGYLGRGGNVTDALIAEHKAEAQE